MEKLRCKQGFFEAGGFPNVIGCIDGTHVRIQAPSAEEKCYVNRKGYHSLNVMAVCDHKGKFTFINAKWPGSSHDSHVLRSSALWDYIEYNNRTLEDGVLLGDSGYPCRPYLMTPYRDPGNDRGRQRYQACHVCTRSAIERTFGRWKRRFHVLHSEIRMKPGKVAKIVLACAILHNIAINLNEDEDEEDQICEPMDPETPPYNGTETGNGIREHLASNYF